MRSSIFAVVFAVAFLVVVNVRADYRQSTEYDPADWFTDTAKDIFVQVKYIDPLGYTAIGPVNYFESATNNGPLENHASNSTNYTLVMKLPENFAYATLTSLNGSTVRNVDDGSGSIMRNNAGNIWAGTLWGNTAQADRVWYLTGDYGDLLSLSFDITTSGFGYASTDFVVTLYTGNAIAPPATTPEPATLAVLGLGLAGLGLTRIRRRK
jgi:hypothetical protein